MEGDPLCLVEGMTIAGVSVGATDGYIYVRSEYPHAIRALGDGDRGAGAYICGEETSLLNSLEGKRGVVRAKPPLPAVEGLFGKPTVVNNVISLASVPWIMAHGDRGGSIW